MTAFRVLSSASATVAVPPSGERLPAARLPAARLPAGGSEVSSAGVGAVVGSPMTPEAAVHLEAYGGSADGFEARQLVPAMVTDSDLVLTATKGTGPAAIVRSAAESMRVTVERIAGGLGP